MCVFFFKQKTAYEMRISDWSSDVCSSDLRDADAAAIGALKPREHRHQRALARSRRAEQRDRRPGLDLEVDAAQNFDGGLVASERQRHTMGGARRVRRLSLGVGPGEDPDRKGVV